MKGINTLRGVIQPTDLGMTLLHEHLSIGMPGWEADAFHSLPRKQIAEHCVEVVSELMAHGIRSILDPCAIDIARDVDLMAEVSDRTGLNIICATGLFNEAAGASSYWRLKLAKLKEPRQLVPYIAELFIRELTEGIGQTGIKAGAIKVATGRGAITAYERIVFEAAALASLQTGAPITTHTECGALGREQQALLAGHGVPADRIIIGHSCGCTDIDYHRDIVGRGSFVGFDQFGYEGGQWPRDEQRLETLAGLLTSGAAGKVIIATDTVMYARGGSFPATAPVDPSRSAARTLRILTYVFPRLRELGVSDSTLSGILVDTPRQILSPGG